MKHSYNYKAISLINTKEEGKYLQLKNKKKILSKLF